MATSGPKPKKFQGKRIVDAKYPLTVHVNEKDIRSSKRANPGECAIARCLIRDKTVVSARVGACFALIEFNSHFERYKVNAAAKSAIRDFDTNATFSEGEYKLLPITPSRRLSGKAHAPGWRAGQPKNPYNAKSREPLTRRRATRNIFRAKEA